MGRVRETVVVAGTVLVILYAQLMYVVTQILTPLSTVPGATLGEIAAVAEAAGEPVFTPLAVVFPLVGVGLASVVLLAAIRTPAFRAAWIALAYLAILAAGLPVYLALAFGVGMSLGDLGDAFPVLGADAEAWLVLAWVSSVAFCMAAGIGAGLIARAGAKGAARLAASVRTR